MAEDGQRKRGNRYRVDDAFGYKPEKDPPRTPPTSDKGKSGSGASTASDGKSDQGKSSEGE